MEIQLGNHGYTATSGNAPVESIEGAAERFESIFIGQMMAAMRRTVGDSGLLTKSNGQKIFESMLDQEWAQHLASVSGPGSLSDLLYRQLTSETGPEER